MIVVLSGEGPSDLGQCANALAQCTVPAFQHGPMTWIVDKIIEEHLTYSPLAVTPGVYVYISEHRLIELEEQRKGQHRKVSLVGKKKEQETGYFYINAWTLGEAALSLQTEHGDDAIAILFRDADGTRSTIEGIWDSKLASMHGGFLRSTLGDKGVPMLPKPKSEVWMLCACKAHPYQNCAALEDYSGNDKSPKSAKKALAAALNEETSTSDQLDWLDQNGFDHARVAAQMDSFRAFKTSLQTALRQL